MFLLDLCVYIILFKVSYTKEVKKLILVADIGIVIGLYVLTEAYRNLKQVKCLIHTRSLQQGQEVNPDHSRLSTASVT